MFSFRVGSIFGFGYGLVLSFAGVKNLGVFLIGVGVLRWILG